MVNPSSGTKKNSPECAKPSNCCFLLPEDYNRVHLATETPSETKLTSSCVVPKKHSEVLDCYIVGGIPAEQAEANFSQLYCLHSLVAPVKFPEPRCVGQDDHSIASEF